MKKYLRTLFCAALVSLPGAGHLFSNAAAASLPPAAHPHLVAPTKPARTQSTTAVYITLPYQDLDQGWDVKFVNTATGEELTFSTNGNSEYHLLGEVPDGVYNVYFEKTQGQHSFFDFNVGCDQGVVARSRDHGVVYGAKIGLNCDVITVDAFS